MKSPKNVNIAVRRQAETDSEVHAALYEWAARIRPLIAKQTSVEIPEVALAIERGRRNRMGWYHVGTDGLQLRGRITVNSLYLEMPTCWVVEIVAHEILHFAEEIAGQRSNATRSAYHTAWFRLHAEALGFPCNRKGQSSKDVIDRESPFGRLLIEHGGELVSLVDATRAGVTSVTENGPVELPPPRNTTQPWSCGCTNIRAATEVAAQCLECGGRFERS